LSLRWLTLIYYNSVTTSYVTYFDIMVTFRKCFFRLEVVKAKGEHFGACPGPWAGTQLLTPVITPLDSQNLEYPWIYIFLEYLGLPWTFPALLSYLADLYGLHAKRAVRVLVFRRSKLFFVVFLVYRTRRAPT
jgi:hypothetical protein